MKYIHNFGKRAFFSFYCIVIYFFEEKFISELISYITKNTYFLFSWLSIPADWYYLKISLYFVCVNINHLYLIKGDVVMRKIPDCQNQFCRYWKDNDCLQNTIAVDERGMCLHFVRVSVPKGYLDRKRKALRKQLLDDDKREKAKK